MKYFKDLIQTVGLVYFISFTVCSGDIKKKLTFINMCTFQSFFRPPYPKSEKIIPLIN